MSPSIARNSDRTNPAARTLVVAAILLLAGYPLAIAWALTTNRHEIAVVLSLFSLAVLALASPRRWRSASATLFAVVAAAAILAGRGTQLSFLPPVIVNLALMTFFGATLRHGAEPLIARFARIERGTLEADLQRYTRRLTWLWTVFFFAMAVVSIVLAALSWTAAWTWFTVVGNWACVGLFFGGEYLYRRVHFAHYTHATPMQLLAIIRKQWRAPA